MKQKENLLSQFQIKILHPNTFRVWSVDLFGKDKNIQRKEVYLC